MATKAEGSGGVERNRWNDATGCRRHKPVEGTRDQDDTGAVEQHSMVILQPDFTGNPAARADDP